MSIAEEFHFDKDGEVITSPVRNYVKRYFGTALVVLVAVLSFGLGRLYHPRESGVTINYNPSLDTKVAKTAENGGSGAVYASSKGTKYYFANCKSSISDQNRITFASAEAAEAAGYTLASTCKP